MNIYKKYCPNVFVAQCDEEYQKGDTIAVTTKYGKENECKVHNFLGKSRDGKFYYSITRTDGFDRRERAKQKLEKLNEWAENAENRRNEWFEKSNEGRDFLVLAEPIKVGHHSEKRHRALIARNWSRIANAMKEDEKAEAYRARTAYWESMVDVIDLSMPESIDFFEAQLEEATEYHKALKDGSIKRDHSFSLTYAKKRVNDLEEKVKTAKKLWDGD